MAKALADRLAEAMAEALHEQVRKEYWGYCSDEVLEAGDLHKIKYQVRFLHKSVFVKFSNYVVVFPSIFSRYSSCLHYN